MRKLIVILCAMLISFGAAGAVRAAPMPLDGTWIAFEEFIAENSFFTGFWEWDSTVPVRFDITDYLVVGDTFEVYDDGSFVFATPDVPDYAELGLLAFDPPWTNDPDQAWIRAEFSKASWVFDPGFHSITIKLTNIPTNFSSGTVAFRATPVPEPATMLLLGFGLLGLAGLRRVRKD